LGTGIGSGYAKNKKISFLNPYAGEIGHIRIKSKQTLEQSMQQGSRNNFGEIIKRIIFILKKSINPDLIIFGGGRMQQPGTQRVVDHVLELEGLNKPKVKISKLKYAGVIGAALPLLKR